RMIEFSHSLERLSPIYGTIASFGLLHRLKRQLGYFSGLSVSGQRQAIIEDLRRTGRPIVVVIDDIDRLRDEDVRAVFQLVKAVADFERVSYLLAFDPKPVDKALSRNSNSDDGRRFREKIVQHSLALPSLKPSELKLFFEERIDRQLALWDHPLSLEQKTILVQVFPLILEIVKSFRDINRLVNKTIMSYLRIKGEVCFGDLLGFEALRLKHPAITEKIIAAPYLVSKSGYPSFDDTAAEIAFSLQDEMRTKKPKERLDELLQHTDIEKAGSAKALLENIFSRAFSSTQNTSAQAQARQSRLSVRKNLLKVLYQDPSTSTFSDVSIRRFLDDPAGRETDLSSALLNQTLEILFDTSVEFIDPENGIVSEPSLLAIEAGRWTRKYFLQTGKDISRSATRFISVLLRAAPPENRKKLLLRLCTENETACLSEHLLLSALKDAGLWVSGKMTDEPDIASLVLSARFGYGRSVLDQIRHKWIETVSNIGVKSIISYEPNALSTVVRWKQLDSNESKSISAQLERLAHDNDYATLAKFLALFTGKLNTTLVRDFLDQSTLSDISDVLDQIKLDEATHQSATSVLAAELDVSSQSSDAE
ncbi:MAG: P-loop NTPase fold protein, partial [Pseudomonadota bacterium]